MWSKFVLIVLHIRTRVLIRFHRKTDTLYYREEHISRNISIGGSKLTKPKELLEDSEGIKKLLLANEAIARGVVEAGVRLVALYPGTPSSEIGNNLTFMAPHIPNFYFEFSTNEKVALEVAGAAAVAGVRSMMVCKGPGLNVAADPFFSLAYVGVRGGMVIVVADDPSMWSSQNENDSRYYALMGNMPMIEPADPAEAKSLLLEAYKLSEELELPVLFRTTTRVNHTRAPVEFGKIPKLSDKVEFDKEPYRFVPIPAVARKRHPWLLDQIAKAKEIAEESSLNFVEGSGELGIITSGVSFNYVREALESLELEAEILKLGITHPVPENMIKSFLTKHKRVVIVEELEPFLETHSRRIAQRDNIMVEILGKEQGYFSRTFEYSPRIVIEALAKIISRNTSINWDDIEEKEKSLPDLPPRPPLLCAGCPHRATYYAIRTATRGKAIYPSDIGCYTLSIAPPLETADILFDMGSSITTACGLSQVTDQDVVCTIGDSTFFASGLPGVVNAVYNHHPISIVVLDNRTTAMTGHQPHPGTGVTGMQEKVPPSDISEVCTGLGVKYVKVIDPLESVVDLVKEIREMVSWTKENRAPAVLVSKAPCALLTASERRRTGEYPPIYFVDSDVCNSCKRCLNRLSCPAMYLDPETDKAVIDETLCNLCGTCVSVCPQGAIKQEEE
ncbi:MAG: indolepyruvate ferredoxin oxidoreductase subunit alpha [Candidatus Lokiarchaeota archaeon]|nr:indolepyruvate ferredoxin oxidoreductase subunit alpha [Candidatus Lokiarchaeota archaeon]